MSSVVKKLFIVSAVTCLLAFGAPSTKAGDHDYVNLFYDFVGKTLDSTVWSNAAIGSGSTISIDTSKQFGEVVLEGDAEGAAILLCSGTGTSYMVNVADNYEITFRAKAIEDDNHPAIGCSHDVNNIVQFFIIENSNWLALTRSGGSSTTTDTGVAQDGDYHIFRIEASSSSVEFYIDDALKATHATNITTEDMFVQVRLDLLQAGQTYFYLDWINFVADRD